MSEDTLGHGEELPAPDANPAESSPAQIDSDAENHAEGEPEAPKKTPWFQTRIDELTAARRDAERQLAAANARYEELRRQGSGQQAEQVAAPTGKPKVDDFDSYEDFTEALSDWKVDQRFQAENARRAAETERQAQAREAAEFQARVAEKADKAPKIAELMQDDTLPVSRAMADIIRTSADGPDMLLLLDQNRDEARRIANLPPSLAAFELGRLAAKTAPARKITQPPAPLSTLSGQAVPITDPDKMPIKEWIAWRNKQQG